MKPSDILNHISDFLDLNKTERRGMLILALLILSVILIRIYYPQAGNRVVLPDLTPQQADSLRNWLKDIEDKEVATPYKKWGSFPQSFHKSFNQEERKIKPVSSFDPNGLPLEKWMEMGFSEKQAQMIKKYEAGGANFNCKEDVAKLWCVSEDEYRVLEPYILLPSKNDSAYKPQKQFNNNKSKDKTIISIEINTASDEEFKSLPGVGPYFAAQIIKRRIALGGFSSLEQLLEIKKMDTSLYFKILPNLILNPNAVRKINVNTATLEELREHPYFTYNISLALINYREQHGAFKSIEEIKKCALITPEVFSRLLPYIKI